MARSKRKRNRQKSKPSSSTRSARSARSIVASDDKSTPVTIDHVDEPTPASLEQETSQDTRLEMEPISPEKTDLPTETVPQATSVIDEQPVSLAEPNLEVEPELADELPAETATDLKMGNDQPHTRDATLPALDSKLDQLTQLIRQMDDRLERWNESALQTQRSCQTQPDCSIESHADLASQTESLQFSLNESVRENEELRQQIEDLAAQIAKSGIQRTVHEEMGSDESLSWEERKALIFEQMEADAFDADAFVHSLSDSARSQLVSNDQEDAAEDTELLQPSTPLEWVENLVQQLADAQTKLADRENEIAELKILLTEQSETRQGGIAIGAAAIAELVDSDELVQQERESLQQLKSDWEDKFRQAEIEASLERAKLSRERQELARRSAELEDRLDDLQREKRENKDPPATGRKWLAELGLGEAGR